MLASSSSEGRITLYDLDSRRVTATILAAASVQAIAFTPGSTTIVAALPDALTTWSVAGTAPALLVTVTDVQWAPVHHLQLCDDVLVAVCSADGVVGVAVVPGMTRLLHMARPGGVVCGVNKQRGAAFACVHERGHEESCRCWHGRVWRAFGGSCSCGTEPLAGAPQRPYSQGRVL